MSRIVPAGRGSDGVIVSDLGISFFDEV